MKRIKADKELGSFLFINPYFRLKVNGIFDGQEVEELEDKLVKVLTEAGGLDVEIESEVTLNTVKTKRD